MNGLVGLHTWLWAAKCRHMHKQGQTHTRVNRLLVPSPENDNCSTTEAITGPNREIGGQGVSRVTADGDWLENGHEEE